MTNGAILSLPIIIILLLIRGVGGVYKQIDKMLNYSMKRKVKWGPFKNLYSDNRQEEALRGPVLDKPNCGTYFPAFMLILLHSIIALVSIIWSLILIFAGYTNLDVKIMSWTIIGMLIVFVIVGVILYYVYSDKYLKHQLENARKISQLLEEKNK